jgi:hypothetical protein
MASEDESQGPDHHHDEKDWDAQKENFRVCYIDKKMTRKDAAQYLRDNFGFDATPRQWERRIKQWGFSKYSSREERLNQIAQTGKSIYEVGRPGRRPRAPVDDYGRLHPHPQEDRNLRRFARREASRSRSRSRSNSFTDHRQPRVQDDYVSFSEEPSIAITDQTFNLHLNNAALLQSTSNAGFSVAATPAAGEPDQPVQLHLLQEQKPSAFGDLDEADLFLTVEDGGPDPYINSGGQEQFPKFSDNMMSTGGSMATGAQDANLQYFDANATPLDYPGAGQAINLPTTFDQYSLPNSGMAINAGILSENMMSERQIFDNGVQIAQGGNDLNQADFHSIPNITFAVIDMDPTTMMPQADGSGYQSVAPMPDVVPQQPINNDGPLQNDVAPLMAQYIKEVCATASWYVSSQAYGMGSEDKLAAVLEQPGEKSTPLQSRKNRSLTLHSLGQMFTARMSVTLENFAKSQQRAFQSTRDTCARLRHKNAELEAKIRQKDALLEEMLNASKSDGRVSAPFVLTLHRRSTTSRSSDGRHVSSILAACAALDIRKCLHDGLLKCQTEPRSLFIPSSPVSEMVTCRSGPMFLRDRS